MRRGKGATSKGLDEFSCREAFSFDNKSIKNVIVFFSFKSPFVAHENMIRNAKCVINFPHSSATIQNVNSSESICGFNSFMPEKCACYSFKNVLSSINKCVCVCSFSNRFFFKKNRKHHKIVSNTFSAEFEKKFNTKSTMANIAMLT